MPLKTPFKLVPSPKPIADPVDKFGGQPVWIGPPAWPAGPQSAGPMRFLCQITLREALFPGADDRVAYVFFEDASEPVYSEAFIVVLQSKGKTLIGPKKSAVAAGADGPTLFVFDADRNRVPAEFEVRPGKDVNEPAVPPADRYGMDDLDYTAGFKFSHPELAGNKIGGQPIYIGQLSTPPGEFTSDDWRLLLQLAPEKGYWTKDLKRNFYPFHLELGEFGILSVFLSADYKKGAVHVEQP
jgi:hypothetical protein